MALPNFMCVGAERAGTTFLWRVLRQHPDVFLPPQKETHYFSRSFGAYPLVLYEANFFGGCRAERAIGEATPEYMRFPEVPGRLRETLGAELKLVFCLRDPVRRAFSQYLLRCRLLEENESFERAVELEAARIGEHRYFGLRRAYVGGSRYLGQIRGFLEAFPRANLFFAVTEEDFGANARQTFPRLFEFLGVAPDAPVRLDVGDSSRKAPRVRFVAPGEVAEMQKQGREGGTLRVEGPAIAFLTDHPAADRAIRRPSSFALEHFRRLDAQLTRELPQGFAEELYRRHFRDEIAPLEELLGRDLSVWRRT
jgi:hypothetical protein